MYIVIHCDGTCVHNDCPMVGVHLPTHLHSLPVGSCLPSSPSDVFVGLLEKSILIEMCLTLDVFLNRFHVRLHLDT